MVVRTLVSSDWPDVARIYGEGLATGVATFETEMPSWEAWNGAHLPAPRLVAERDGTVKTISVKPGDSLTVDAVIMEFA